MRVLGPDHPHTLATRHNLATWQGEAGDPAGATHALDALLTDVMRVLGPDHPHTLATRHNLATWRTQTDEATAANLAGAAVGPEQVPDPVGSVPENNSHASMQHGWWRWLTRLA
jgi:hypothetical protein